MIEAVTPKPALSVEGADVRIDSRMIKDDRVPNNGGGGARGQKLTVFDPDKDADKLG